MFDCLRLGAAFAGDHDLCDCLDGMLPCRVNVESADKCVACSQVEESGMSNTADLRAVDHFSSVSQFLFIAISSSLG